MNEVIFLEQVLTNGVTKANSQPARTTARKRSFYDTMAGYLFISPMLITTTVLTIIPIVLSAIISFTDWNFITGLGHIKFIGINNYLELLRDGNFLRSMKNNIALMGVVPVAMFLSLVLAVLINKATYFKTFFKVIYFMPFISSFVAVAVLWRVLFHPNSGPINGFLKSIGIEHPPLWLADPNYALVSVMIIMVWASLGFNMIIFLAGLQNIPKDLYEAADIDGASVIKQFFSITLPLLSPTTFFLLITGIVSSFKAFDLIMILTNGGPAGSTSVIVFYLYETAFINLKSGYASAIGMMLLFSILIITIIQWVGQKRWVNY
ncbi:carbohydrate ABC transporter permease [Paenibacillus aceris]|uniref:Multiple sugar transport system permease protein n=1 Tax=Paenibacillus aceris TaxID=869555 RepID=A0ABS4I3N7_9BACL|nr:sugar ABC transporter permease [Paenibacillus aceris]MBP1965538.1 multiple sugar transport system permease protein [Paenibacillus aceris]NHW33413.1 sugar ABC transporter permease [Paenibacillus aceris]